MIKATPKHNVLRSREAVDASAERCETLWLDTEATAKSLGKTKPEDTQIENIELIT